MSLKCLECFHQQLKRLLSRATSIIHILSSGVAPQGRTVWYNKQMARPKGIPSEKKGKPQPWATKAAEARRASGMYDAGPWNKGKKTGLTPWNKGKTHTLATRTLLSMKLKGRKVWNTGMGVGSPLGTAIRRCDKYKVWRTAVFVRDGYKCAMCGSKGRLQADHIKPFALICKEHKIRSVKQAEKCNELWNIENGRTLCVSCHKMTDTYSGKVQTQLYTFPRQSCYQLK